MTATKLTYFNLLNSIHLKLVVVDFSENFQKKSLWACCNILFCEIDAYFLCLGVLSWIPQSVGAYGVLSNELNDLLPIPQIPGLDILRASLGYNDSSKLSAFVYDALLSMHKHSEAHQGFFQPTLENRWQSIQVFHLTLSFFVLFFVCFKFQLGKARGIMFQFNFLFQRSS